MPQPCLVITSWPNLDGAQQQARNRMQNKLATSVNILPQMDSIYDWLGALQHDREHKIYVKINEPRLAALQHEIKSAPPYTVAEILQIKIDSGDPDYLDWISASTQ